MGLFDKGSSFNSFFSKGGFGDKLLGGIKGAANILDEPLVQAGITAFAPEVGLALGAAKKYGVLEKLKH